MKQIKLNVGSDTYEKWERIAAGYTSNVAAFAAIVENYYWRHQMHEEEDEMDIRIQFSENSLFGGWEELTGIDLQASSSRYAEVLEQALRLEYPMAEIVVERGIIDRTAVNGQTDSNGAAMVQEIEGQVYQEYDSWVVYE